MTLVTKAGTTMYSTAAPPSTPLDAPELVEASCCEMAELIDPWEKTAETKTAGLDCAVGPFCSVNHKVYTVDLRQAEPVTRTVRVPLACDQTATVSKEPDGADDIDRAWVSDVFEPARPVIVMVLPAARSTFDCSTTVMLLDDNAMGVDCHTYLVVNSPITT